jgi:hypothetical protein
MSSIAVFIAIFPGKHFVLIIITFGVLPKVNLGPLIIEASIRSPIPGKHDIVPDSQVINHNGHRPLEKRLNHQLEDIMEERSGWFAILVRKNVSTQSGTLRAVTWDPWVWLLEICGKWTREFTPVRHSEIKLGLDDGIGGKEDVDGEEFGWIV